ncbi:hypothetical protein ACTPC6_00405 [Clostridioides difficile]
MDEKNKRNSYVTLCMFIGAGIGIATGFAIGISQGKTGISMCYGLVIGMASGAGIGTIIEKNNSQDKD